MRTLTLLLGLVSATAVLAANPPAPTGAPLRLAELDADDARQLSQDGNILPLGQILQQVQQHYPGRVIEVELDEDDDRYLYEFEIVGDDGIVREIEVDAGNGEIIKVEQED